MSEKIDERAEEGMPEKAEGHPLRMFLGALVAAIVVVGGVVAGLAVQSNVRQNAEQYGFAVSEYSACVDQSVTTTLKSTLDGFHYASADEAIATVDATGVITMHAPGTTTVTAKKGWRRYKTTVTAETHDYKEATCTQAKTCRKCGVTEGGALGHEPTIPTCTEPSVCNRCGEKQGEALGHVMLEATCTVAAICEQCKETFGEPLGHQLTEGSCTENSYCTVCGYVSEEAPGHTPTEATCTEASVCAVCGETLGKALGHDYEAATCDAPKTCKRCGATKGKKLSHNYERTDKQVKTEGDTTITTYTYVCTACGKTKTEEKRETKTSSSASAPKDEQAVYDAIIALKASYPEGMHWTNDDFYAWNGGTFYGGYGCAGFAFICSDAAFGKKKATTHHDMDAIRVGDILRVDNDTHMVIVLEVHDDYFIVAEGNYNSSIHWGRKITRSKLNLTYVMTRY